MSGIASTIQAKSDQLNSEDILSGPITVRIREVKMTGAKDQPVAVFYNDDTAKPWKPCKTMRRLMVYAWGNDETTYAGKLITLFRDERVKWAGEEIGGIRLSHMSHIGNRPIKVSLTVTKGIRAPYVVEPLQDAAPAYPAPQQSDLPDVPWIERVLAALNIDNTSRQWKARMLKALAEVQTAGDLIRIERHQTVLDLFDTGDPALRSEMDKLFRETAMRLAPTAPDAEAEVDTGIEGGDGWPGPNTETA